MFRSLTPRWTPLESSSRTYLSVEMSRACLHGSVEEVARTIIDLFTKRGYPLVDRRNRTDGFLLKFKGIRQVVTTAVAVPVLTPTYGYPFPVGTGIGIGTVGMPIRMGTHVRSTSDAIGSVYYASLVQAADGATVAIALYGKPTLNSLEVCSSFDREMTVYCDGVMTGEMWHGRAQMLGREEAEVIRGILAELALSEQVVRPPPVATPPQETE
ncbi:MAG: hypothetical protein V2A73_03060 [Pseudomonadota bacterium]